MAVFDTFHIGENFHSVGRTFYDRYRVRICCTTLDDLKTIFYMIVIEPDNMAGEEEVFDGMCSAKSTCRSETGELALQLLCRGMVSFCMVPPNSVYDGGLDRMNAHNNDFKERHDFGLF